MTPKLIKILLNSIGNPKISRNYWIIGSKELVVVPRGLHPETKFMYWLAQSNKKLRSKIRPVVRKLIIIWLTSQVNHVCLSVIWEFCLMWSVVYRLHQLEIFTRSTVYYPKLSTGFLIFQTLCLGRSKTLPYVWK